MSEELVIKQKLVTDEKLLRRTTKRLVSFLTQIDDEERRLQEIESISLELENLELNMHRHLRSINVQEQEVSYYEQQKLETEKLISLIENEISLLESDLIHEQLVRSNKDEYDLIAKQILKYPSTDELTRLVVEVEEEMVQINQKQSLIQEYIEKNTISVFENISSLKDIVKQVVNDIKSLTVTS